MLFLLHGHSNIEVLINCPLGLIEDYMQQQHTHSQFCVLSNTKISDHMLQIPVTSQCEVGCPENQWYMQIQAKK
jgi:hypothetical protein